MAEIGNDIQRAKKLLDSGKLIGLPTETVYGLAGNALNEDAITQIFSVKNRPSFDPLIVHTHSPAKLEQFVKDIPERALPLIEELWPGPLTLLLSKKEIIPSLVTSGLERVAVRVPNHPVALGLLKELDYPLAAPSANPFGYISPTKPEHVQAQLGDKIDYILDGSIAEVGIESTIVGFEGDETIVYRQGGTSIRKIKSLVGSVTIKEHSSSNPNAPGMLKSHYAPRKPIILGEIDDLLEKHSEKKIGVLSFSNYYPEAAKCYTLSEIGSTHEAAKYLFSYLRKLDESDIDLILTELVPDKGLGGAINDRLNRAAAKT